MPLLLAVLLVIATVPAEAKRPPAEPARPPAAEAPHYGDRPEAAEFVDAMVERHGFERPALERVFRDARRNATVLRLIAPAPSGFKRSWKAYRARFLDPLRVREGVAFWRTHEAALERARATWQVPPEIVVAIIGVETIYGRVTGDFRVLDALSTLAFDYPRRADYFRSELEQFLLHAREDGADVTSVRGSFAGAIGLPQFMPGSIRRYATDFDGDGKIDLRASPVDAIGSVARFLAEHGWRGGEPTHYPARFAPGTDPAPLIEAGIEPRFTAAELAERGVGSPAEIPADALLALIDLPNADADPDYHLGARNFYVITRYNRSSFYAMAVIELAEVLASAR
ncbi:lytic murein transglycosylase B [Quisquiliibacterium transsilvanicum]|uniref:Membrane-bound lytic murein transglycosylase B n=1 Tax=Quisquiliibacterium transsilvanicum TaxID=1549638 RepID=A0A7W8HJH5_9BURK|nr:lytic murein transglycosylase B [Quisquiliibacterium transsilvanicum]MBB5272348.1 membrane-bound lytic murein transglycosylase B [Quisquiliibacterium transsilvanicum]